MATPRLEQIVYLKAGFGSGLFTTVSGLWAWVGSNNDQIGVIFAFIGLCFSIYFGWRASRR